MRQLWLAGLSVDPQAWRRGLAELPSPSRSVDREEVCAFLLAQVAPRATAERLAERLDELAALSRWYRDHGWPSKAEVIAHLVVPLFRALGWPPEKVAVGWEGADLTLFENLPRGEESLAAVVEVTSLGEFSATRRRLPGRSRVRAVRRETCSRLIVTNGWVYAVYLGKDGGFGERPGAYLNLARMRESYPLFGCGGAKEALLYLSFGWEPPAAQIEGAQVHEDYETPYEEAERK